MRTYSLYIFHPGRLEDMVRDKKWQVERIRGSWVLVPKYKYVVMAGLSAPISAAD